MPPPSNLCENQCIAYVCLLIIGIDGSMDGWMAWWIDRRMGESMKILIFTICPYCFIYSFSNRHIDFSHGVIYVYYNLCEF